MRPEEVSLNIIATRKDLIAHLERAAAVADRKSAVPALANVLLTTDTGRVHFAATDLYLGATSTCDATVEKAGEIALPAKDLLDRVKAMPDGPVQITATGTQATIKAVGAARRFLLHGLPAQDFPALPRPKDEAFTTIPASLLAMLMARTHFSISTDETRAHVNSALFEIDGARLRMVSTDGHRLSKAEAIVHDLAGPTRTMLIPLRAVSELRRICDAAKDAPITIAESGPTVFFTTGGATFSCKTVESAFPPWQQVLPAVAAAAARAPRAALIDALKAAQVSANARTGGVKVTLAEGVIRVAGEDPDAGSAFDEVAADYDGREFTIGVNAKYLLDVLGAIDCDEVIIGAKGELDPFLIRPAVETPTAGFVACVMPMRI